MTRAAESQPHGPRYAELSACEQFLQILHEKFPGAGSFTAVLRFRGQITPEPLARALKALQHRHPLLRAAIVSRDGKLMYEVADVPQPVSVEWIETENRDLWQTAAVECTRIPFDVQRPPFLRLTVLQKPGTGWSDLLITMHHVIADGRAVATMLQDLQTVWSAADHEVTLPVQNWIAPQVPRKRGTLRAALQRLRQRFSQRRQLRGYRKVQFDKLPQPTVPCCREVLSKEETTQLRTRCRIAETTPYGAIAAATLQALAADPAHTGCQFRIDSPIDFRTVCEPRLGYDQVGCYVWILGYRIAVPEAIPFWELARRCRQQLESAWQSGSFQRTWHWLPWLLPLFKRRRTSRQRIRGGVVSINDMGAVRSTISGHGAVLEEMGWYSNREHTMATFVANAVMLEGRINLTFSSPCHTPEQLQTVAQSIMEALRKG